MSKEHSTISIIVPCYNVELYLKDCVESIIEQTYPNWELILVNDGSKDQTPQLCDQYAAKDHRITVIHQVNGGLVSARNAGYEVATGYWIMYVDGDDWISKETCEKLMVHAKIHEPEVIFWNRIQDLGGKSTIGKNVWKCKEKERLYLDDECKQLAKNTLVYTSGISTAFSKLISREFAQNNSLIHNPKLKQGAEGIEFSLRVFGSAKKVLFINEYFYHYRYNENSISKKVDEKNTQYIIDCFNEIDNYLTKTIKDDKFHILFNERILYVLIAIALSTYFHKNNNDPLSTKITKYKNVINKNTIFRRALENGNFKSFDIFRMITLYIIKLRFFVLLPLISASKQFLIKKGIFSY